MGWRDLRVKSMWVFNVRSWNGGFHKIRKFLGDLWEQHDNRSHKNPLWIYQHFRILWTSPARFFFHYEIDALKVIKFCLKFYIFYLDSPVMSQVTTFFSPSFTVKLCFPYSVHFAPHFQPTFNLVLPFFSLIFRTMFSPFSASFSG